MRLEDKFRIKPNFQRFGFKPSSDVLDIIKRAEESNEAKSVTSSNKLILKPI